MSAETIAPVQVSVVIQRSPRDVFRVFTKEMGAWWPLATHSIAADTHQGRRRATDLVFEDRVGGRIYEKMDDGSEGDWGKVLVWEPPQHVVFSWKPNLKPGPYTEVEVRFIPEGSGTRVVLEHRGWERFADDAAGKRATYEKGWPGVLERFAARANAV